LMLSDKPVSATDLVSTAKLHANSPCTAQISMRFAPEVGPASALLLVVLAPDILHIVPGVLRSRATYTSMVKFTVASLASAWLVGAQTTDNDLYHPHAAFAFIRTGDRTPNLRQGSPNLTALGAQQMVILGQNLRTRYITGNAPDNLGIQHIAGLSPDTLNNDQIMVQTSTEQHIVSSAQAFMQGLYPPHNIGNSNGTGTSTGDLLSNGSVLDFPLGGYQYANIKTSGSTDPDSIFVSGNQNCPIAKQASIEYYTTYNFTQDKIVNDYFYDNLNLDWFEGNLKAEEL
jgi:hypothetical protein